MGLNYAFVLVLERSELPRLDQSITARLAPNSSAPGLADPAERSMEEGDYRFATGVSSPCLVFLDPTLANAGLGCVYLERVEGLKYSLVWLRAATSDMSRRFETDLGIRKLVTELSAEAGVLAIGFDREEARLTAAPGKRSDSRIFPVTDAFLPFWCSPWGAPRLPQGRKRALEARATILGARRPTDSDAEVMEALLDDDAFDADVDGFAAQLLVALASSVSEVH